MELSMLSLVFLTSFSNYDFFILPSFHFFNSLFFLGFVFKSKLTYQLNNFKLKIWAFFAT